MTPENERELVAIWAADQLRRWVEELRDTYSRQRAWARIEIHALGKLEDVAAAARDAGVQRRLAELAEADRAVAREVDRLEARWQGVQRAAAAALKGADQA